MQVTGFDHVVLISPDPDATLAWYRDRLGLEVVRGEEWARREVPFPSVRVSADTIIDLLPGEPDGRNADHICLVIEPTDLAELAASPDFDVVEGPAPRYGAQGDGWSVYVRDPDGNVVELRHYGSTPAG